MNKCGVFLLLAKNIHLFSIFIAIIVDIIIVSIYWEGINFFYRDFNSIINSNSILYNFRGITM